MNDRTANETGKALAEFLDSLESMTPDVSDTADEILQAGVEEPLKPERLRALMIRITAAVREGALARGDIRAALMLDRRLKGLTERAGACETRRE